jgi:hypothetical protein
MPGATDWELSQLYQSGRLGSVTFMEGGAVQTHSMMSYSRRDTRMPESIFKSTRTFQVWLYTVSHSILLLRSVKDERLSTRIDVLFKPVRFMSVPATLAGIDVRLVDRADLSGPEHALLLAACGPKDKVFALSGERGGAWVVAGVMAFHEDEGAYADQSHFDVPRMVWQ